MTICDIAGSVALIAAMVFFVLMGLLDDGE